MGADSIAGGVGDDYLSGQNGNDEITGDLGLDRLLGGGDDILAGGAGADSLTGSNATANAAEIDRLMGGADADMFALGNSIAAFYNDGDLASNGMDNYALIEDFNVTEDIINCLAVKRYLITSKPVRWVHPQVWQFTSMMMLQLARAIPMK